MGFVHKTVNNITFLYRTNSVKNNYKIFKHIKKTLFFAHFCPFSQFSRQKLFFTENPALSRTTSHEFLAPCLHLEKTNDKIPRKNSDRRTEGREDRQKDEQTLFHRAYPATAGSPIKQWYFPK